MKEEGMSVISVRMQIMLLIATNLTSHRIFGYGESIGIISKVDQIVVNWLRRHLMMT